MTNTPDIRSILTRAALRLFPPLIQKSLLAEPGFRKEYEPGLSPVLSFDANLSIQSSDLFKAVRAVLSGASAKEVVDTNGQNWKLKNIGGEGELPHLELSFGEQHLILPCLAALSPERSTRLRFLEEAASDVYLPMSAQDVWRNLLSERALEDDEVDTFLNDFKDSPIEMARAIRNEILKGQLNISTLVPHSRVYFERLIGAYNRSATIRDYAASNGRMIFDQLLKWNPYNGFLFSLFLSWHSSLTAEINVEHLSSEELVRAFDFLDRYGDGASQVGAIEVGFRLLSSHPEIEPFLIRLIKQVRDDNFDSPGSQCNLLSALFIFVDGELSRTRLLSSEPPFYRRLAALSQAALIHRQLKNASIDIDQFSTWAISNRAEQYYMQSIVDMRSEPRWHPDLADAVQLKAEFIGRILSAAKNCEQNIKDSELSDLVLGNKPKILHSLRDLYYSFLPGPLEGVEDPQITIPSETIKAIDLQLGSDDVSPSSFIALVNSALIYRANADQAELAARVLKLAGYRLSNMENKAQFLSILNGLSSVAAISRSRVLADTLRIIIRIYRRDTQYGLSIDEVIKVGLLAAASIEELNDWREYVGDFLSELAFSDLKDNEGEILHSHLRCLLHAVPELWVSCGRAEAALVAYNSSLRPD